MPKRTQVCLAPEVMLVPGPLSSPRVMVSEEAAYRPRGHRLKLARPVGGNNGASGVLWTNRNRDDRGKQEWVLPLTSSN